MSNMKQLILIIACLIPLSAHANEYTALASRAAAELQAEHAAQELYREQAATAAQELVAEMQAQREAEADAKMMAAIEAATKPLHAEIEALRAATVVKDPEPVDERPVVTVYTIDGCVPCQRMKNEAKDLPVKASFQKPTKEVKEWVDEKPNERGYPVIHYQRNGKWWFRSGYRGVDDFKKWWGEEKATGVKPILPYSSNAYTPHWTWPGNLAQHLRSTHGINTDGMTQDQMEQAHDRSHDGGFRASAQQHASGGFLNFGRRRGGCPNGMCPR